MTNIDRTAKIEIFGCHGEYFCISGPGMGEQGVILQPKLKGAIDAPVKTLWVPGAFGQSYVDFRWQRRDVVFTVEISGDGDADVWEAIDSKFRFAFDYGKLTEIRYTTAGGSVRSLYVQLLEEPKAYEASGWEGKDPHLYGESTTVYTVAAELPFYVGQTEIHVESGATAKGRFTFDVNVDCDIPVWPKWTLTDQAIWRLPDFSWGYEEYGTGIEDMGRMIQLKYLPKGAGLVVDSDPRRQTFLAKNRINYQGLMNGQDLLYPIQGGTYASIPVEVSGATQGWACKLEIPKWYSRPWSRPVGDV